MVALHLKTEQARPLHLKSLFNRDRLAFFGYPMAHQLTGKRPGCPSSSSILNYADRWIKEPRMCRRRR